MVKNYFSLSRIFKISALAFILIIGATQHANACHGVPIVGLTPTLNATDLTLSGFSDGATCGCGPYWMQVEVTCNPSGFTGSPPVPSDPSWGTAPWFESGLNVPGYGPPSWIEQCAQEPYFDVVIPFSGLCPGTTYYYRVREYVEGSNSSSTWAGPFSFTTPGLPPSSILSTTANVYAVCPGATVQLNATVSGGCPGATFTYSWMPTTGLSNPNIANPTALISSGITYTVTTTGGCFTITSNDDTVQITIGPPPAAGTTSAVPTSVCSGGSSVITLSGQNPSSTIQWQNSPNGISWFNISGATTSPYNTGPLSSSLYYQAVVTGSGWPGSGCGSSTSAPVLVTVNPSPNADAGLNTVICSGSCTNLTGTGGVTYTWQPGNLTGSNVTVCPSANLIYTLTVVDANGCTDSDYVAVNLSNATVTASPDVSICGANSTILVASGPNGNTYNWSPSGSLTGATTANPTASPTVTTTYTVTATNSFGCTHADSVTVTVTTPAPITVSADTAMCAGGTAILTASGATSFTWQPGNQSGPSVSVTPASSQTYTVTGNTNNCISIDSVTVNITPPPAVFAGPDFSICSGSQAAMNVATTGSSYLWQPSSGIIGSNTSQTIVANPGASTSYTVTVTGASGCIMTDTINVTVNSLPTVSATSPDNTICIGSSTTVNATGGTSYQWIPAVGLGNPANPSTTANPVNTTTYQVIGTDANGCTDTAAITIIVNPLPLVYMIPVSSECGDSTGQITMGGVVTGTGPFTYTMGATTQNNLPFNNLPTGSYTVTTTDVATGCVSSQVISVGMVNTAFVNAAANPTFGVYPLPVNFASSGSPGLNNYHWDFGDFMGNANTSSANYTYNNPGTYTVVLVAWNDLAGCAVYDTISIEVVEQAIVMLPNVFTPNSDGTNDGFASTISGVKGMRVEIFNRWGNNVFEGEQSGLPATPQTVELWDGKAGGGKVADDGVYYYVITATGYDTKEYTFTGFVHLLSSK